MIAPGISFGAASAVGRRPLNEDAVLAAPPIFVVADGMGGHEAGEVASGHAVAALSVFAGRDEVSVAELTACLRDAAERIRAIATAPGMGAGTTVTGICLTLEENRPYWMVFNVGDSRTYRFAGDVLKQVSVDHSEVQELVDAGKLSHEDAGAYARRNVITRALGAHEPLEPDFWLLPVTPGERLLLCSDGLTGEVPDEEIARVLREAADPQDAAETLVHRAVAAGGRDNVSVVVVDAEGEPDQAADTLPRGARVGAEPDELDVDTRPTLRSAR